MKKSVLMIVMMLAAGLVFAGEGKKEKGKHGMSFETLDANKDGKITLDEFKAGAPKDAPAEKVEAKFKKIDANADGSVTKDEMDAAHQKAKENAPKHETK